MSDFLTNLAARSLAAPTLRPRTRSRFEPEANASPWAALPSPEIAEPDARPSLPPVTRRTAGPSAPEPDVDRQSEPHPARRAQRLRDFEEPAPERRPPDAPIESRPHDIAPPSQVSSELRIERIERHRETSTASHTLEKTERVTERVLDRVREQHDTTVRVETPHGSNDDASPAPAAPRHRHDEQPPRIAREPQQSSPVFVTREPRPSSRPAHDAPATSSEPVIHVSIGRVEVRAVAPAATPQRSRPRNAPMTVDDYAARRNAKRRP